MRFGKCVRLAAYLGLVACAPTALSEDLVSGEGRGSGAAYTHQVPVTEPAGVPADAVRVEPVAGAPKSIICGLYISGIWQFSLDPGASGGPRAYVSGAASPNDLRINNTSLSCFPQTGTLRLEYWVATNGNQPLVNGGLFFGTPIAIFPNNGQLFQGQSFININGNAPYTLPAYGTYWLVLVLSQFQTGICTSPGVSAFCYNDSYTSSQMITIGNSTLTVSKNGTGSGTVTGVVNSPSPASVINCGATCQASVFGGYSITLSATPAGGSNFAGWSGGGCSGTLQCTVSMSAAQFVTATFNLIPPPQTFTLNVSKSGSGTVTSSPPGIACGATCSANFSSGTVVSLTATPAIGYNFTGWTLDCSGTGACNPTMNANRNVTALFSLIPVIPTSVRTDFNDDGKSDLLYRNATTGQIYRMLMNGFTITNAAIVYTEPNTAWRVVQDADFNGDGIADLLYRNVATGQVFYLPFNVSGFPSGGAIVATEPNAAWKIVHTPDLNGDGKSDILWWNSTTGQVYAMIMNGGAITAQGIVYTEPNTAWKIVAVGDFAGSGKTNQLVWRNSTTGQVFLMTVTVTGSAFSQTGALLYSEANTAWKIIGAADFNDDGKSDILYRNDATGQVYMMLMNGGSVASAGLVYTEPNLAWKIVAQGDYNGDGKADLLWRNDATGQVYMMRMNGLATSSAAIVYAEPNTAWKILGPWEYGQASGIQP